MRNDLDWQELKLFDTVARAGSLAVAARLTGLSPATLSRRTTAFENALGERLLERGPRGLAPTARGEALLAHAARMRAVADDIERWRTGAHAPRTVRVSAGGWTAGFLIERARHWWSPMGSWIPELVTDDARRDVGRREIDVGVRNARPLERGLVGRRAGTYASAAYRARGYPPDGPELGWVGAPEGGVETPTARWVRAAPGPVSFVVDSPPAGLPLVRQGLARAVIPCFVGDADASLERDGDPIEALAGERWLVAHEAHRNLAHVRAAIDALARFFEAFPTTSDSWGDRVHRL